MIIISKIFQYKIYRRIIVSYFLLVAVTVSLLSIVLFYLFSASASKEIDNKSKEMLSQVSYTSDVVYNQVVNISNQLLNDNNIISFLYSNEDDKIVNYNVYTQLQKIQSAYPFIKSMGLYNLQNGFNIDTVGVSIEKNYLTKNDKKYIDFFPRTATIQGVNSNLPNMLITFVLYPDFSFSKPSDTAIVINIDEEYILNTIKGISGSLSGSTFVIDSEGLVLSHTDPSFFIKNISDQDHINKILKGNNDQGSFTQNIDGKKQLVTYVRSSRLNWYFVSISPYSQLIHDISRLRDITIFVTILLIILGIFISPYLTGIIYNPMKALIDRVYPSSGSKDALRQKLDEYKILTEAFSKSEEEAKQMKSSISKSALAVKESYLRNLLKGGLTEIIAPEEIIKNIESHLKGPLYCAIIFKIDDFCNFSECNSQKDKSLLRFAICNIAQELLSSICTNDVFTTEEDEVAVMIQLSDEALLDKITGMVSAVLTEVKRIFCFSISASIGDVEYSKNDIFHSYKSSQEYIKYRLFYGHGCILDATRVKSHFSSIQRFPYSTEKNLIEAIQLGNRPAEKKLVEEFIEAISHGSYYQAINHCSDLILNLFKHFEANISLFNDNPSDYLDTINKINSAETITDISGAVQGYCEKISLLLDEKNNKNNIQKYSKIIQEICRYVENHYCEPGLSLETVADIVKLSPGYLGKLFKGMTNTSFNDCLNNTRLGKARELLSTTAEPASRICERVGIYNVTYFSTLFKKTYGMTPSQFRENVKNVRHN